MTKLKSSFLDFMTLFSSFSTLFCCALPALFVALGAGAVFAGLVSQFPQLVWLSENKGLLFIFSGSMLALSGFLQWKSRNAPCPVDPKLAKKCMRTRSISRKIYFSSLSLFVVGGLFAYVLPHFMEH